MTKESTLYVGKIIGRLTIIKYLGKRVIEGGKHPDRTFRFWLCKCECGNETNIISQSLYNGRTKSCGCLKIDMVRAEMLVRPVTHGMARGGKIPREYNTWSNMKVRCKNPNSQDYKRYGGRGIRVCERWDNSFKDFYDDMGPKPSPGHSIERIDVNGDYEPGNCKWATHAEQYQNRRCSQWIAFYNDCVSIRFNGEIVEVSEIEIIDRIKSGMSVKDALTTKTKARP